MSSRYSSFESESKSKSKSMSFLRRNTNEAPKPISNDSAIVKIKKDSNNNNNNLATLLKKFMDKSRSSSNSKRPDFTAAHDLKKIANKGIGKGKGNENSFPRSNEALTEVKANTRSLAMVLRSERELLSLNKEHQSQIVELNSLLHHRATQVEKLKDLCLKQREEIKSLKTAILFPEDMNSQLKELLGQQGSAIKQANHVIPTLQTQISSLTDQLQSLSQDLAEVKAVSYKIRSSSDSFSTQFYDQKETANSLDFSFDDPEPDSPDNMLLKDVNPLLTPCYSRMKAKSQEHEVDYEENLSARTVNKF